MAAIWKDSCLVSKPPSAANIGTATESPGRTRNFWRFLHKPSGYRPICKKSSLLCADAFGPAHLGCGPDANCSRGVKAELAKILEPYRIGKLAAPVLSDAARQWPDVEPGAVRLRLERSDGSVFGIFTVAELRKAFKPCTKTVTHQCSTSGNVNTKEWTGVRVSELLPRMGNRPPTYETLVTFVGMDGFGYSMFWSRAMKDDVILAYSQDGEQLDAERGGPLRLVKDGQHAKWIETIIVE
eukprot:s1235_g2.t2